MYRANNIPTRSAQWMRCHRCMSLLAATDSRPGICGTQVKSSGNKNWMSPSRRSDGAYFSETPPSWHVRPYFSLMAIVNY